MKKFPYCSAQLQNDAIVRPACGQEIKGIGVRNSVMKFFQDINQEMDEEKKISLIKTFPFKMKVKVLRDLWF